MVWITLSEKNLTGWFYPSVINYDDTH